MPPGSALLQSFLLLYSSLPPVYVVPATTHVIAPVYVIPATTHVIAPRLRRSRNHPLDSRLRGNLVAASDAHL